MVNRSEALNRNQVTKHLKRKGEVHKFVCIEAFRGSIHRERNNPVNSSSKTKERSSSSRLVTQHYLRVTRTVVIWTIVIAIASKSISKRPQDPIRAKQCEQQNTFSFSKSSSSYLISAYFHPYCFSDCQVCHATPIEG